MANWTIKNVAFRGVTGTVPNHPVKTSDIPLFTQEEADTFDQTVGIRNRYWSSDDICTSDLCADAAERLITALGWEKQSIDVLLFVSVTPDYKTPPTDWACRTPPLCWMFLWVAVALCTALTWLEIC